MPFLNSVRGSYGANGRFNRPPAPPGLYVFTSATFTPGGQSGRSGPSLSQARSGVGNPSWATTYVNMSTPGIIEWTVPETKTYRLEVVGAAGGRSNTSATRGAGARIITDVSLTSGTVLNLVVGQMGSDSGPGSYGGGGGGGGGSFVYTGSIGGSGLICVAGGAGGNSYGTAGTTYSPAFEGASSFSGIHGQTGTSGSNGGCDSSYDGNPGLGGTNGGGGGSGATGWSSNETNGGGAGWLSDAVANPQISSANSSIRGTRFTGGNVTVSNLIGGWGGGGGVSYVSSDACGGGGGGGYSGGGGAGWWANGGSGNNAAFGGGGGSFYTGNLVSATSAFNTGQGYITITKL